MTGLSPAAKENQEFHERPARTETSEIVFLGQFCHSLPDFSHRVINGKTYPSILGAN